MSWKNYSTLVLQCCWRQKTGKVAFCFLVHGLATFVFVSSSLCIISLWASSVDMVSILVSAGQERNNGLVQLLTKLWQRNFPDWCFNRADKMQTWWKIQHFAAQKSPQKVLILYSRQRNFKCLTWSVNWLPHYFPPGELAEICSEFGEILKNG